MESWILGQKRIKELFIKAGKALKLIKHQPCHKKGNKKEYQRLIFSDAIKDFTRHCPLDDSAVLQHKRRNIQRPVTERAFFHLIKRTDQC